MHRHILFRLVVAIHLALGLCSALAADLHVAPKGTPSGHGSEARPYDLRTALTGNVGRPGDTFWLAAGLYPIGHIDTQAHGAPDKPLTFRQAPGQRAQVVGSVTVWGEARDLVFQDFELYSGDTNRLSRQLEKGFTPTDITNRCGIQIYSPTCKFINLVVHDATASGFYSSAQASNTLIYGCIVFNCGWASPDNAEGHSFYFQSPGELVDNIVFNSTGAGFHVFASGTDGYLRDITLDGNVAFGAGALQSIRPYRDWLVGVDPQEPAREKKSKEQPVPLMANGICLKSNMGYLPPNSRTLAQVQLGRQNLNGVLTVTDNYWPLGLILNNWRQATFTGNLLAPAGSDYLVDLQQSLTTLNGTWDSNAYVRSLTKNAFRINSRTCDFAGWKTAMHWDTNSSCLGQRLSGLKVFLRPNRYEPGRANIVVYNWDCATNVAVDVISVLRAGTRFEVRNAQDFFGPPVLSGTFEGKPLNLPMSGLRVAAPMGPFATPPPTGPRFNVFVLLPIHPRK